MTNKLESQYLDKLEYDKSLDNSWYSFFIDRKRFTILIILMVMIAWWLWLKSLPLESNPEVNIWIASVIVTLPWATPESMEDLVTKKLEKEVAKIKWIDTMTSNSQNSVSSIVVQFKSDVDIKSAVRELKDKVDEVRPKLPSDIKEPIVKEFSFSDTPIWTFSISWDYDGFKLYDYAKKIRDELEKISLISEVNISGWDQTEFLVSVDPKKLETYWLTIAQVNSAIQNQNFTFPIWDYDIGNYTHSLTIDERFYNINNLKKTVITKLWDTWIITLSQVATVKESAKKVTSISRLSVSWNTPKNSVTLWVIKKSWWSIVNLVTDWQKVIDEMKKKWILPQDLTVTTIVDQSERIKLDLHHLIRDWIITVILVFVTLFLIIWVKEALVAWTSVPLVFLITFCVMAIYGQTLNFLSMFALILSLWLLVDDAIVVISAINQYRKTGKFTVRQSAILVLRDYHKVLITTTLTVVWIFSAMLFMTWIIWKFIFSIPFVITITLLASLVMALTVNPTLAVMIEWEGIENKSKSKLSQLFSKWFISLHFLELKYWKTISYLVEKKSRVRNLIIWVLLLFFVALSLPIAWILKSDFFPKWDQDNIYINIEAEPWTRIQVLSERIKYIEEILLREKEITSFSTSIGGLVNLWRSSWWWTNAWNYASISINLVKKEYWRKENSMDIASRWRKVFDEIKDIKVNVVEVSSWPPAWGDFELKIAWEDFIILDKIANDVKKTLSQIPWTQDISTSRKPLPFEYNFVLDSSKLSLYNITIPQVWVFLKNTIDWIESTKIYAWTDEIVVKTKYDLNSTDTLDKIKDLKIKNNLGQNVYIRDLIKEKFKPSVFSISRENQKRIVTVSAWARKGTTWAQIKSEFDKKMKNYKLPADYEFITGGANEENAKSVQSLLVALIFWMIFIVATLILLYDSFRQSVLVLLTIPLSLIWVFFWLTLFNQPLSFPGLIWLVALFWIVVRNWIILFDKINQNLKENIPFNESIIDAWVSRLEPVLLTSICTILGMIPLTLSNPTWTSLWLSIIFWLAASTFLTLLVLPSLFYLVFRKKYIK